MSRDKHRVYLQLLASFSASVWSQSLPGCPPPISSFISYPEKVTVPKISPFKVATLQFRENTYFGSARCSLVQDLTDKKDLVLKSFRLEESSLNVRNSKVKTCTVFLINDKLQENVLNIEVILVVTLNEGYRRFCQSNSIISSTASIEIHFCDPERCHDKKTGWEIVGNVVSYKNGRSVDSDGLNQVTQTLEITGGQNLIVEADTKTRNQDQGDQEAANTDQGSVNAVQRRPDADVNNKVVLGLALVVTLIALSLILGLIYFWCPALCCCMRETARGKINLDSTKILTVRDAQGKIIEDAKSVEVWKTQGNTIRTLEVVDNKSARSKNSRYSHLLHSDPSSGTLTRSSNLLPDSETTRSLRSRYSRTPVKVINVGENLDGLIILRKTDQTSRSRNSRVTLLEELNPRKLIIERESDNDQDRVGRLDMEYQDTYRDRRPEYQDPDRSQRYEGHPDTGRRLSFSRHYSAKGSRERDSPAIRQVRPR